MAHLTIADIEASLSSLPADRDYIRVETGRYKPFMPASVEAARRRGLDVKKTCDGVFLIRKTVLAPSAPI